MVEGHQRRQQKVANKGKGPPNMVVSGRLGQTVVCDGLGEAMVGSAPIEEGGQQLIRPMMVEGH